MPGDVRGRFDHAALIVGSLGEFTMPTYRDWDTIERALYDAVEWQSSIADDESKDALVRDEAHTLVSRYRDLIHKRSGGRDNVKVAIGVAVFLLIVSGFAHDIIIQAFHSIERLLGVQENPLR